MDIGWQFWAGVGIGAYIGWGYRRLWQTLVTAGLLPTRQRPLRLVRNDYTPPSAPEPLDHTDRWRESVREFLFWGNMCGFSERVMMAEGVASRPIIRRYRGLLAAGGLLTVTERGGTTWRAPWNYPRARVMLKHKYLTLPYPKHAPWPLRRAWLTAQMAQAGADGAGAPQEAK